LPNENAASHFALRQSYAAPFLPDTAREPRGTNSSALHIDCMLGNAAKNVDGKLGRGDEQRLIRAGEFLI
jgi:aminopeptidase